MRRKTGVKQRIAGELYRWLFPVVMVLFYGIVGGLK